MTQQWRNRVNSFLYAAKRQYVPKARAALPGLYLPLGWSLITWSAFGLSGRAWAASGGAYIVLDVVLAFVAEYFKSKRIAMSKER